MNVTQSPTQVTTTVEKLISLEVSTGELVFIGTSMTILSLLTIVGNIFVLMIYLKNTSLQCAKNYFILSLAIADIIIGLIPVNLYTVYLIYGYWPLGVFVCQLWLVVDYWACTVSTLTLLTIAFDRFYFTWFPINHRLKNSRAYVKKVVLAIWIVAFLIWAPAIILYPYAHGEHTVPDDQCYIQFLLENPYVTFITAFCTYYGPVFLTTLLYAAVSAKVVDIKKGKKRVQPAPVDTGNEAKASPTEKAIVSVVTYQERLTPSLVVERDSSGHQRTEIDKKQHSKRSRKSLQLLLLIILAFSVSWLPYYLVTVVVSITKTQPPERLWRFCYIVGWGNSFLNPLCYAFGSKSFKKGFIDLITCARNKRRSSFSRKMNVSAAVSHSKVTTACKD